MPEIHLHIPAGLAADQVIHVHLSVDGTPAPDATTQPAYGENSARDGDDSAVDDSTVEGMLAVLEASGSASPYLTR